MSVDRCFYKDKIHSSKILEHAVPKTIGLYYYFITRVPCCTFKGT